MKNPDCICRLTAAIPMKNPYCSCERITRVLLLLAKEAEDAKTAAANGGRRRDRHFTGIPSPSILKHLLKGEGGAAK